eukprot:6206740-Pleurochrysis_carterae.AAC.5
MGRHVHGRRTLSVSPPSVHCGVLSCLDALGCLLFAAARHVQADSHLAFCSIACPPPGPFTSVPDHVPGNLSLRA